MSAHWTLVVVIAGCVIASGCAKPTTDQRAFLTQALNLESVFIGLEDVANRTWNSYASHGITEDQAKDILTQDKNDNTKAGNVLPNIVIPAALPGSNYPIVLSELRLESLKVDETTGSLMGFFEDKNVAHVNESQRDLLEFQAYSVKLHRDMQNEILVVEAAEK